MTPRPTTCTEVEADLRARADFRGIDDDGRVHFLFGMATQMLAQANSEISRLKASNEELIDACREALDWSGPDGDHISDPARSLLLAAIARGRSHE